MKWKSLVSKRPRTRAPGGTFIPADSDGQTVSTPPTPEPKISRRRTVRFPFPSDLECLWMSNYNIREFKSSTLENSGSLSNTTKLRELWKISDRLNHQKSSGKFLLHTVPIDVPRTWVRAQCTVESPEMLCRWKIGYTYSIQAKTMQKQLNYRSCAPVTAVLMGFDILIIDTRPASDAHVQNNENSLLKP